MTCSQVISTGVAPFGDISVIITSNHIKAYLIPYYLFMKAALVYCLCRAASTMLFSHTITMNAVNVFCLTVDLFVGMNDQLQIENILRQLSAA